jgi:hypothetical protein
VGDRYVKLVFEEGHLRLVYSVSYGPIGAARARQGMDENRDGRLTTAETRAAARSLGARIVRAARLSVDGAPVSLAFGEPFVGPAAGPVDTSPLTIELSATVELPAGESLVRLSDLPELDGVERSDYAFEARAPVELLASGSGDDASGSERLVSFLDRRARGPRVLTARVRLPGTRLPGTHAIAAGAALAVLIGVGGVWWARRRSRRRSPVSEPRTGT